MSAIFEARKPSAYESVQSPWRDILHERDSTAGTEHYGRDGFNGQSCSINRLCRFALRDQREDRHAQRSSPVKIEAIENLDVEVITYGGYFDEALQYSEKLAVEKGYICVHGINEPLLHEGVGTMHLEIIEEQPSIDVVINPIGGGSGASGACIVYKTLDPRIRVIGVQAEGAPAFYNSWKEGSIKQTERVTTVAEGLATAKAYDLSFRVLRKWIDNIVLVSDDELKRAVKTIFLATGQVAELAGAASTAAAFKMRDQLDGKKVALLVSGGNIQPKQLSEILMDSPPF